MSNKESEVKIKVSLDENNIPEKIIWDAPDVGTVSESKSAFLSVWDKEEKKTLSLNLWTKEFNTDEMKHFFHQTFVSMVESFERAVPDEDELIKDLYATCNYFAEKTKIISTEELDELAKKSAINNDDVDLKNML